MFGKASSFDATLDLSSLDGTNGFQVTSDLVGFSVSSSGDVNGDGFDDLIVSAPNAGSNSDYSGSSYVVLGKASGFDASHDLSDLNGSNGFRLNGEAANDNSGWSASTAGDVNGDGFDDLMVAAPHADPNGDFSGSSYVVFGRSDFTDFNMIEGTPGDDILVGSDGDDNLIGHDGNDTIDGGMGNDVLTGD